MIERTGSLFCPDDADTIASIVLIKFSLVLMTDLWSKTMITN
jgi:hypothetical protein